LNEEIDVFEKTKLLIGAAAFKIGHVDRIHIIGCARTGTTFLQYCMLAYKNANVVNSETSPNYPGLVDKLKLTRSSIAQGGMTYITKRTYGWFQSKHVEELVAAVSRYHMGVILMIRDPRAVMASTHRLDEDNKTPYVDEERWYQSILAGEEVWRQLADYPRKCILRYEDLVLYPNTVDRVIMETFALERQQGLESLNQVKSNAERVGYEVAGWQQEAMQRLRNADPTSLDHSPPEVQISSNEIRAKYNHYLGQYSTSTN